VEPDEKSRLTLLFRPSGTEPARNPQAGKENAQPIEVGR